MAIQDSYSPRPVSRALHPELKYSDDLFNYTRGRFVCEEGYEMSQRQVRFNVNELVAQPKLSERNHVLALKNIPMACTTRVRFSIQMLAYLILPLQAKLRQWISYGMFRELLFPEPWLGVPRPRRILVGAEYIIIEKVLGIELERVWSSMNIKDRVALVKTIAGFQKAWTSVSFKKFGGLYYTKDLDESTGNESLYVDAKGIDIIDEKFARSQC